MQFSYCINWLYIRASISTSPVEKRVVSETTTPELVSNLMKIAISNTFGNENFSPPDAVIFTGKADKGDYQVVECTSLLSAVHFEILLQSNAALSMSKKLGLKPIEIATKLSESILSIAATSPYPVVDGVTISGPGFLNLQLSLQFLQNKLRRKLEDPNRVGISKVSTPQRVIVDYSSPNIAKEMHVVISCW